MDPEPPEIEAPSRKCARFGHFYDISPRDGDGPAHGQPRSVGEHRPHVTLSQKCEREREEREQDEVHDAEARIAMMNDVGTHA